MAVFGQPSFFFSTFFFCGGGGATFCLLIFNQETILVLEIKDIPELSLRLILIFKMNHGGQLSWYHRKRETLCYNRVREEVGVGKTASQEFYNIDLQILGM